MGLNLNIYFFILTILKFQTFEVCELKVIEFALSKKQTFPSVNIDTVERTENIKTKLERTELHGRLYNWRKTKFILG